MDLPENKRFKDLRNPEGTVSFDVEGYVTEDSYWVVTDFDVFLYNLELDKFEELKDKQIKRFYFDMYKCKNLIMDKMNKSYHRFVEVLA